jgi:hypothetical protein
MVNQHRRSQKKKHVAYVIVKKNVHFVMPQKAVVFFTEWPLSWESVILQINIIY